MNTVPPPRWHPVSMRQRDWSGCWAYRVGLLVALPHRVRALLCYEWLKTMLPFMKKAFPAETRAQTALESVFRWVQKPTRRNESVAFAFSTREHENICNDPPPLFREVHWELLSLVVQSGTVVRDQRGDNYSEGVLTDAMTWTCNVAGLRLVTGRVKREQREAWCWRTFQAAKGPDTPFDPAWRTSDAVAIAKQIYSSRDLSAMPILADALEEAGMNHADILSHLREDSQDWTLADWALTNLLGIFPPEAELPDWFDEENQSSKE